MVDAKVVEALIDARAGGEQSLLSELTRRELEILGHMAQGKSNQAIAEELFLSKRAVEKHINAIFMKLGLAHAEDVSRRVKAALIYLGRRRARTPPDITPIERCPLTRTRRSVRSTVPSEGERDDRRATHGAPARLSGSDDHLRFRPRQGLAAVRRDHAGDRSAP